VSPSDPAESILNLDPPDHTRDRLAIRGVDRLPLSLT